jgi:hypothetical protein
MLHEYIQVMDSQGFLSKILLVSGLNNVSMANSPWKLKRETPERLKNIPPGAICLHSQDNKPRDLAPQR